MLQLSVCMDRGRGQKGGGERTVIVAAWCVQGKCIGPVRKQSNREGVDGCGRGGQGSKGLQFGKSITAGGSALKEGMEECPGSIRAGALSPVVAGEGGGGVSWGAKAMTSRRVPPAYQGCIGRVEGPEGGGRKADLPGAAAMSTICSPSCGARAMTGRKEEAPCSM